MKGRLWRIGAVALAATGALLLAIHLFEYRYDYKPIQNRDTGLTARKVVQINRRSGEICVWRGSGVSRTSTSGGWQCSLHRDTATRPD
jgi:hypothetical protein